MKVRPVAPPDANVIVTPLDGSYSAPFAGSTKLALIELTSPDA
eukprot:SAG22_NODE_431_length_10572_cov_70.070467_8_plen_43_part_00